jgi:hypothetical protein
MKDRLFSVAGVSRLHGEVKVRFATDTTYVKGLTKAGNTDVELFDAGREMSKPELVEFLKTTPLYENAEYRQAIDARAAMYAGKDTVKVSKTSKAKPDLDAIRARAEAQTEAAE